MYNIQNLLGGLTQGQLFMLQTLYRDSVRRRLRKEERQIKVANGVQVDMEAIGNVSLELANSFILLLRDVLYVSSLQRNLYSVSCLDNDGYGCHFGNGRCEIICNYDSVGIAFLKRDLYLSLHECVNFVCSVNACW